MVRPSQRLDSQLISALEAFNVSAYIRENPPESLAVILDKRKNATQALIARFIQLGDANRSLFKDPAFLQQQSTTTEVSPPPIPNKNGANT